MIFEFKGRWYRRMPDRVLDHPGFGYYRHQTISLGKLSTRALKLYKRLIAGYYYMPHSDRTPKAMEELVKNGLVGTVGRVIVIERCFVPAHGYTEYKQEEFSE